MMFGLWLTIIRAGGGVTTSWVPQLEKEPAGWWGKVCFQVLVGIFLLATMVLLLWVPRSLSVHHQGAPPVDTTLPFFSPPRCPTSGYHVPFLFTTKVPQQWVPRSFSVHHEGAPPVGTTFPFCSPTWCPPPHFLLPPNIPSYLQSVFFRMTGEHWLISFRNVIFLFSWINIASLPILPLSTSPSPFLFPSSPLSLTFYEPFFLSTS